METTQCASLAPTMSRMSSQDNFNTSIIDGTLSTSLAEDVFTLVGTQLTVLDEFLEAADLATTEHDAVAADALLSIFRLVCCKQLHYGRTPRFLCGVESCIARANDYSKMQEKTSAIMRDIISQRHYNHLTWKAMEWDSTASLATETSEPNNPMEWDSAASLVEQEASRLADRLNLDAVEASQTAAIFVIQAIQRLDIPRELFGRHWEENLTNNEVAKYIVTVFGNYLSDIKDALASDYLYHQVVVTLARCTVCFYLRNFILKADRVRRSISSTRRRRRKNGTKSQEFFRSPERALMRMTHDIQVFQNFFQDASNGSGILSKIVANEFSILGRLLLECSGCAAAASQSRTTSQFGSLSEQNLEEFIVVVYKQTGADTDITRHFLSDVFMLMSGGDNKDWCVRDTVQNMKEDLDRIKESIGERNKDSPPVVVQSTTTTTSNSSCFCLEDMLAAVYEDRILQENTTRCGVVIGKDARELRKQIIRNVAQDTLNWGRAGLKSFDKRSEC
uniref:Exocyst complex component Sec6 n=1 Tax=Pseudo-nitzschia australis TaxID=44445 RepID=A0A7S4AIB5_9STRA